MFSKLTTDQRGFKKVMLGKAMLIIELVIPKGATIYTKPRKEWRDGGTINDRKRRASSAQVIAIYRGKWKTRAKKGHVPFDIELSDVQKVTCKFGKEPLNYIVGEEVYPHEFSKLESQSASGIHYFKDAGDAINWQ